MKRWYLYPELYERDKLIGLLSEGMTIREICERVGCTRAAVASAFRNHGIKLPLVGKMNEEMRKKFKL